VIRAYVAYVACAAVLASLAIGCGGGSVCGNGKPELPDEQCDDGNTIEDDGCTSACRAVPTRDAQFIWTFAAHELPGFTENCTGVGAAKVKLDVTGPKSTSYTLACGDLQFTAIALAAGSYSVTANLLDAAGTLLTKGGTRADFVIPEATTGTPVQVKLDFAYADFVRTDYVGDWYYQLTWGGAPGCTVAVPPVTDMSIRIERGGHPVVSTDGKTIDGVTPEPCTSGLQAIQNLPWGPASVTITGFATGGAAAFKATFPTFLGAGISNPTLAYDVTSLAPDAGVPDATVPDAQ
jgi:cysteine-rich repeat protein